MPLGGLGANLASQVSGAANRAARDGVAAANRGRAQGVLAQPLNNLLYLKVDDNWLQQHPNIARVYDTELTFVFFDNESGVQEAAQANYNSMEVIGRPESFKTFSNTNNKVITLPFRFMAQGLDQVGDIREAIEKEVTRPVRFLDSLQYPIEDEVSQIGYAPPPVYVQIGNLLRIRAIVTDVSINWTQPFDPETLLPLGAEVDVTFEVVRQTPVNYMTAGGPVDGKWQ